jgi:acetyltransferase-like isoleucine patch superfamily enzyme
MIRNLGISNKNMQRLLRLFPNFLWPLKILCLKSLVSHGKKFQLGPNVILYNYREIKVGNKVFIGDGTTIGGRVPVAIGDNVMFGPEVMVRGGDHNFTEVGKPMAEVKSGGVDLPIVIENDVWIGTRVIILKGVRIREGAVIGAGSLLTKEVPPYSVCVGSPAKAVRSRFTKTEMNEHLKMVKTQYSFDEICTIYSANGIGFRNG